MKHEPPPGGGEDFLAQMRQVVDDLNAAGERACETHLAMKIQVRRYLWLTRVNVLVFGINAAAVLALLALKLWSGL